MIIDRTQVKIAVCRKYTLHHFLMNAMYTKLSENFFNNLSMVDFNNNEIHMHNFKSSLF